MTEASLPPVEEAPVNRKNILIRLLFTILFFFVLEIVKTIIQLATVFQYIYLLITLRSSEPVRNFANRVSTYGYRIMRYLTLNDNLRPFPFNDYPGELEPPEAEVRFE